MIRNLGDKQPKIHHTAFISEAACVIGDVEIGENSSIWPGAVIRGDFGQIVVGKNTHIEDNCVVHTGKGVSIGDDVIIGHGAIVHCSKIGNSCMIGNGAILLDDAEVEDGCIIAAGSVVAPGTRVPACSLYMGNPARFKERLTDERVAMIKAGAIYYCELAKKYKDMGL